MKVQKITAIIAGLFFASSAFAIPALQVDIGGGIYDNGPQDVVTSADTFTVYALGTPSGNMTESMLLIDTFYLSIAITPKIGPGAVDFGVFTVNGVSYDWVQGDMVYGTPPTDTINTNPDSEMGSHDIYDTFYLELGFSFDANQTSATYNVDPDAGGPKTGTGSYWNDWDIDVSGMGTGFELHFDLYHTAVKDGKGGNKGTDDIYADFFAPFSHDGSTVPGDCCTTTKVPAPATLLLLGLGLASMGATRRKQA